ncbi:MAG TPA: GNAT family N-acetyltransferase [Actinomycetes bacterium]|nr:GNAT family N-acetyltransferase [Actinomycetes bacterium]
MTVDDFPLERLDADGLTPARAQSLTALIRDAVTDGAALGWVLPPDAEELTALFGALADGIAINNAATAVVLAPSSTNDVVAFGYWRRYSRPTNWPQADLPLLVVRPSERRQGLAGTLLDELIAAAREKGIEQITLDARGDNLVAQTLWRSRGFTQYGLLRDFVAVGERRFDKTFWVLDLRAAPVG